MDKKIAMALAFAAVIAVLITQWPKTESTPVRNAAAPATVTAQVKPCTSPVNPTVAVPLDCEPPGLPPDPGAEGMATIDGIDADHDGMRDDVQRYIAEWRHSPLAVASLTLAAQGYFRGAHYGASINKEETVPKIVRESACIAALETQEMHDGGARRKLKELVLNTEDRQRASQSYNRVFHGTLFPMFEGTPDQACGFDVAAMARAEGTRTMHDRYREESIEFSKLEEQGVPK